MHYFLIVLSASLLGIFFIGTLRKLSLSYNLLILKGIPLIGGVGLGLSFIFVSLSSLFLYQGLLKEAIGVIVSSSLMLVFGLIDDWGELSIWAKLFVQIVATTALVFFGVKTKIVFFGTLLNLAITYIWVLAITNAFNHLDIMDGLAAGTAIIVSFAFFIISLLNKDMKSAILSLTLTGAAVGFFIYNLPPAKIYMGNAGSHFLGFALAAIALIVSYAPLERKVALLSPLLILGFPIFDTAFLFLVRLIKNNVPFKKSNDHLALRFLALGYSKRRTLFTMLILCLFFCLCGIAVSQVSNLWGMGTVVFAILVSLVISIKMSKVAVNG